MATQMISNISIQNGDVGNLRASAIPMATVDSSSTSTAFTATVLGLKILTDGACCWIRNNKVTSASGCTLNVNSLGAKPIYISNANATAVTTQWANGHTCLFVYNSTRVTNGCWDLVVGYDTNTDTKNTAGSTDTSSKIFLIGATSQAANPQTYSDNEVFATSGVLTTKKVQVGGGSGTMEYNSTTQSIDFVFA